MQIIRPSWQPKSTTVNYFATDSLELHRDNLSRRSTAWRWRDANITYGFNSTGHRMREWTEIDWTRYIAVFGCSNTLGVGLPLEQTWAYKLAEGLEVDLVNCAEAGTSAASQVQRVFELFLNAPSLPRLVVFNWPPISRRTYWFDGGEFDVMPENTGDESAAHRFWVPIYQRIMSEPTQDHGHWRDLDLQLRSLCQRANVPIWQCTSWSSWPEDLAPGLARPRHWQQAARFDLDLMIEDYARDVSVIKTSKQQRKQGWPERMAVGHHGVYHQEQLVEAFWRSGVSLRW